MPLLDIYRVGDVAIASDGRSRALLRTPEELPFAAASVLNLGIGAGATWEAATDTRTAALLAGAPELNSGSWSVQTVVTSAADPLRTVTCRTSANTWTIRVPDGFTLTGGSDAWGSLMQPDGSIYDGYAWLQDAGGEWSSKYDLLITDGRTDHGIENGRRASNTCLWGGVITPADLISRQARHMLALAIPAAMLNPTPTAADGLVGGPNSSGAGWVWPANGADNQATTPYGPGPIAMGAVFGIPSSVDITALGLTTDQLLLARFLQDCGAFVAAQADTVSLVADPDCDAATIASLRTAWRTVLFPLMRLMTNNDPGTLTGRVPDSNAGVLGGGARRIPAPPDFA